METARWWNATEGNKVGEGLLHSSESETILIYRNTMLGMQNKGRSRMYRVGRTLSLRAGLAGVIIYNNEHSCEARRHALCPEDYLPNVKLCSHTRNFSLQSSATRICELRRYWSAHVVLLIRLKTIRCNINPSATVDATG
ncbi:uncharacterized protein LOC143207251 [Lasioglossum baleicum]|uniref:uncharacterized protein LOC143207251 n=1 Tax=Lasioglossum baleicum TaxID=434251 RepID=UPI003FCDA372